MPILKYLDVFTGLAFVMVLCSTVVAAITQIVTSCSYLRAQFLRQGLADLLRQMDPGIDPKQVNYVAQLIQRHPGVARPASVFGLLTSWFRNSAFAKKDGITWLPASAPAVVLQRHEFVRILIEWAAGEGPLGVNAKCSGATEIVKKALEKNGIKPAPVVKNQVESAPVVENQVKSALDVFRALEYHALQQERTNPDLASHLWHTAAEIDACPSQFIGKVHAWYDSMTSRVSERYALRAKIVGSLIALGLALYLPLDTIGLVQRLSADEQFRKELVSRAEKFEADKSRFELNKKIDKLDETTKKLEETKQYIADVNELGIGTTFKTSAERKKYFEMHWSGLLLSWVLLSLGTPFWYDALKNALRLRSVLAQKDDKDKAERQRTDTASAPGKTASQTTPPGVVAVTAQPVG